MRQKKKQPTAASGKEKNVSKTSASEEIVRVGKETRGRKPKYENQPEEIECIGCRQTKSRDEFGASKSMRGSGTSSYCKECQVDINTQYRYRKIAQEDAGKLHEMRGELAKRIQFIDEALAVPQPPIRKNRIV